MPRWRARASSRVAQKVQAPKGSGSGAAIVARSAHRRAPARATGSSARLPATAKLSPTRFSRGHTSRAVYLDRRWPQSAKRSLTTARATPSLFV
ncbi:hypothetical protein GA0115252_15135 [Streptomyces sp. DfronAA-171]|nr:hypothetical protein GA0115252_15135 [Streptomyces sp. DfronAA-171]